MEMGLVEREKISPGGRGRPTFCYRLTVMGHKLAGANPAELADAMWREIVAIEDGEVRDKLLASIAARLGRQYADQVAAGDNQDSLEVRMKKFSEVLADRHIKMAFGREDCLDQSSLRSLIKRDCGVLHLRAIAIRLVRVFG